MCLKIEYKLTDYLSCTIQINQASKARYVMQPQLIKSVIDKFGEEVANICKYGTPGTPQLKIVRPDDADKVDAAMQSKYWHSLIPNQVFEARLGKGCKETVKMHGWCKSSSLQGDAESY
jgi:hypothetical protein